MASELEVGKLTVQDATLGRGFFEKSGAKSVEIGAGGTGSYVGYDSSGYLEFASITGADAAGYSAKMKIDSTGNVQIGTGSLAAVGAGPTLGLTGAAPEITLRDSAAGTPYAVMRTNDNGNLILEADSGDNAGSSNIEFKVDGATKAAIASSGIGYFDVGGINLGHETITKYDEGTFTPTLNFGGATTGITYGSIRGGVYTRIGRLVYVQVAFALTSKGTATGDATITGMPFNAGDLISATSLENAFSFSLFNNLSVEPSAFIAGTTMTLRTLNGTNLADSDFINSTSVRIAGCYALASS